MKNLFLSLLARLMFGQRNFNFLDCSGRDDDSESVRVSTVSKEEIRLRQVSGADNRLQHTSAPV